MLDFLQHMDDPYVSRGDRIRSLLDGVGSAEILPGHPDVVATPSDLRAGDRYDPDIDFDPESYSRMDKFDAVEIGQGLIDSELDRKSSQSTDSQSSEEK